MKRNPEKPAGLKNVVLYSAFLVASCMVHAAETPSGAAGTFYRHFFVAGGPIVWFVLLPMSIATLYLAADLLVSIRRSRLLPPGHSSDIATQAMRYGTSSLPAWLSGRGDLVSRAVLRAFDYGRQFTPTAEYVRQCAAEALQERGFQLMRKAQWCQIIGSVAPMVGLFGTVFGMIQAFNLLGQGTDGPRYELLAEAISVALVTTFWGLLVGIPALFFYGLFQTRIEAFVSEAAIETEALLIRLFEMPPSELNGVPCKTACERDRTPGRNQKVTAIHSPSSRTKVPMAAEPSSSHRTE